MPDAPWKPLIDSLGYSVGFLIVVLGGQQLFTESTLTAVLPVVMRPSWKWLFVMLRLWGIVLLANLVGCALFATMLNYTDVLSPSMNAAMVELGAEVMAFPVETCLSEALPRAG